MEFTWVQDRTSRNVIHRRGCTHVRLDWNPVHFEAVTVEAAMAYVAEDNGEPGDDPAEWVSVSPCVTR